MSNFHFTSESPPEQLFTDVKNLNALNATQLGEVVNILFSFLSNEESSDLLGSIAAFCDSNKVNSTTFKSTVRGVVFFLKSSIRSNSTPLFVKEDLVSLGLEEDKAVVVATKWKQKFISLSRSMIGQTLSVNQLVDMEWKSGVTASSSSVGKVGSAFLQLKLVLDKGNNTSEDVFLELSLPQFYEFYHEMQKAKSSLELFSS